MCQAGEQPELGRVNVRNLGWLPGVIALQGVAMLGKHFECFVCYQVKDAFVSFANSLTREYTQVDHPFSRGGQDVFSSASAEQGGGDGCAGIGIGDRVCAHFTLYSTAKQPGVGEHHPVQEGYFIANKTHHELNHLQMLGEGVVFKGGDRKAEGANSGLCGRDRGMTRLGGGFEFKREMPFFGHADHRDWALNPRQSAPGNCAAFVQQECQPDPTSFKNTGKFGCAA